MTTKRPNRRLIDTQGIVHAPDPDEDGSMFTHCELTLHSQGTVRYPTADLHEAEGGQLVTCLGCLAAPSWKPR